MINYAVAGCGVIGEVHCSAIDGEERSRLYAVCDIIPKRADIFAGKYKCAAYYDYSAILENPEIDAVVICLPHYAHRELFEAALKAGKHVVCEKPLATTPRDLYLMADLAGSTPLKTTVAFQHRHSPLVRQLKDFMDRGYFGDIEEGHIDFRCIRQMDYYRSASWRGRWESEGGGLLINQAIHTIDLAGYFLGPHLYLQGGVENRTHGELEIEDFASGRIIYGNGAALSLRAVNNDEDSWMPVLKIRGSEGGFALHGSERLLELNMPSEKHAASLRNIEDLMAADKSRPGKECYGNLHFKVISDFTDALCADRQPLVSVGEALKANEIVLGFYHATATGGDVCFPINNYKIPLLAKGAIRI